jgi:beta-keto acid cleavage enzyme
MKNKVIISCAVTGSAHSPTMSDAPITPEEIAEQAGWSRISDRLWDTPSFHHWSM